MPLSSGTQVPADSGPASAASASAHRRSAGTSRPRRYSGVASHRHEEGKEDGRGRLPDHQRPQREPGDPGRLGPPPLAHREQAPLGPRRHLPGGQVPGQDRKRAPRHGVPAKPGNQHPAPGRPREHRRRQPPPRPRPAADAHATSSCMNTTLPGPWSAASSSRTTITLTTDGYTTSSTGQRSLDAALVSSQSFVQNKWQDLPGRPVIHHCRRA
jgi:hypothetical protein